MNDNAVILEKLDANQRVALERLDALEKGQELIVNQDWWMLVIAGAVLLVVVVTHSRVIDLLRQCFNLLRASREYHDLESDKRGKARQELTDKVTEAVVPAVKQAVQDVANEQAAGQSGIFRPGSSPDNVSLGGKP